jgi:hypothetical protein
LAQDETGEYYERFVKKQAEILGRLNQRQQHKHFLVANRVSKRTVRDDSEGPSIARAPAAGNREEAKEAPPPPGTQGAS